jgi:hypothetical protein
MPNERGHEVRGVSDIHCILAGEEPEILKRKIHAGSVSEADCSAFIKEYSRGGVNVIVGFFVNNKKIAELSVLASLVVVHSHRSLTSFFACQKRDQSTSVGAASFSLCNDPRE